MDVTVAIPTFNGEEFMESVIESILSQKTKKQYELLIVDSGSTDRTLDIIRRFGDKVRLVQISNSEFGHGKTRNAIAKLAKGEIIMYLTQDAVPAHENWLNEMMHPFSISEKIVAVFGKQIPRPDCMPLNKRDMINAFAGQGPDGSLTLHYRDPFVNDSFPATSEFFSDANSAVRRTALLKDIPYRDVPYAEDRYLAEDILNKGLIKAYVPYGSVIHSHNYKLKEYFGRVYDEYAALKRLYPERQLVSVQELLFGSLKDSWQDIKFIIKDKDYTTKAKLRWLMQAPIYNILRRTAGRAADKGAKSRFNKKGKNYSLEQKARKR